LYPTLMLAPSWPPGFHFPDNTRRSLYTTALHVR
jgi:hypothetical protein